MVTRHYPDVNIQDAYYHIASNGNLVSVKHNDNSRDLYGKQGAFWLQDAIPSLGNIQNTIQNFDGTKLSSQDLTHGLMHIGYMISLYADSQVENFDDRLTEIHDLSQQYEKLRNENADAAILEPLAKLITSLSLALGYEAREQLGVSLREIRSFGGSPRMKFVGGEDAWDVVDEVMAMFPSQWISQLRGELHVKWVTYPLFSIPNHRWQSSYEEKYIKWPLCRTKVLKRTLALTPGKDSHLYYPTRESAQIEYANNVFMYHFRQEAIHEISHLYEKKHPWFKKVTNQFLVDRSEKDTDGLPIVATLDVDMNKVYRGNFSSQMTGTDYGDERNEIFARGMEAVLAGTAGSLIGLSVAHPTTNVLRHYNADIEHRNLIIGLLAYLELEKDRIPLWQEKDPVVNRFEMNCP